MSDVFISYSRRDQAVVRRVSAALADRGKDAWVDWEDIPPSADWFDRIQAGIREAQAFVFVVSPDSLASQVCAREIEYADAIGKRIVPVLVRDVSELAMPEAIARRNWISFLEDGEFDANIELLVRAVETDLEYVAAHTRWLLDAERWLHGRRHSSLLLSGPELRAAETWLTGAASQERDPPPTSLQYEFILAGRRAAARRLRLVLGIAAVAVLGMGVLSVFAVVQRNQAEEQRRAAESRELSASALLVLPDDPELSLLLARRAAQLQPTEQAAEALRQSLLESRVRLAMQGSGAGLSAIAYSPDGALLAGGDDDGSVHLWDERTGRRRAVLRGHKRRVHVIRFSADGSLIASAAQDSTVRLWDPKTGRAVAVLTDRRDWRITDVSIRPDGRQIAVANFRYPTQLWNVARRRPVATLKGYVVGTNSVQYAPDGSRVLATGQDGTARLYSTRTAEQLRVLSGHRGEYVWAGAYSPTGELIATASSGGDVRVWDPDGHPLAELPGPRDDVEAIAFSPDGQLLAGVGKDRTVRLYDLAQGGTLRTTLSGHQDGITAIEFSPDGRTLATSSSDGTARIWDVESGRAVAVLRGHRGSVTGLAYRRDSARLVTSSNDGTARAWAASPDTFTPATRPRLAITGEPVVDPTRQFVLFADPLAEGRSTLVRLDDDRRRDVDIPARSEPIGIGPNGKTVVVGGFDQPAAAYDLDGKLLYRLDGVPDANTAAFSADGRYMAVASHATVSVFDASDGALLHRLREHESSDDGRFLHVDALRFSPDAGVLLSVGEDGTARVWDTKSGKQRRRLPLPKPPQNMFGAYGAADISRDGSRALIAVGWDLDARIFDLASGEVIAELEGHAGGLSGAHFGPGDQFVVTASNDGSARVWDPSSGRTISVLRPQPSSPDAIGTAGVSEGFFEPAGRQLLLAAADGIYVYDCDVCGTVSDLVGLARSRVTRGLTRLEQQKYLHVGG